MTTALLFVLGIGGVACVLYYRATWRVEIPMSEHKRAVFGEKKKISVCPSGEADQTQQAS